jgi:hypothetical protein
MCNIRNKTSYPSEGQQPLLTPKTMCRYKYRTYMEPNKKFRKEAQTVRKKANSFKLLTGETGGSYFSTKMDASRQDCAIPPCHGFYLLLQMSSNTKNKDSLSKQLSINLIEFTPIQKYM